MIIPCAIVVSAADREGSVDDDAQSAKSTPIKSKPTGAPHSHVLHYGGRGYALRKPATLFVLACALRPLHTWYPIQMESFDSRWERHQRRRQARDNDEAAPKSVGGSRARLCTWENSTRDTEEGWDEDRSEVYSTPSKKVRCML